MTSQSNRRAERTFCCHGHLKPASGLTKGEPIEAASRYDTLPSRQLSIQARASVDALLPACGACQV